MTTNLKFEVRRTIEIGSWAPVDSAFFGSESDEQFAERKNNAMKQLNADLSLLIASQLALAVTVAPERSGYIDTLLNSMDAEQVHYAASRLSIDNQESVESILSVRLGAKDEVRRFLHHGNRSITGVRWLRA